MIDINCDMGEIPEAIADGSQEALMPFLSSVNIACGGHAGDTETMRATIQQARRWNLALGAHPSYPDRANFGRLPMAMPLAEIADTVCRQVSAFATLAKDVHHVKAHGALYNAAAVNESIAAAIAEGVARWSKDVILYGLAGSSMLGVFIEAGFPVAAEAFPDRRYEPDGTLRSRTFPDALITDPQEALEQARGMIAAGKAQTLCIHGDGPTALEIARALAVLRPVPEIPSSRT